MEISLLYMPTEATLGSHRHDHVCCPLGGGGRLTSFRLVGSAAPAALGRCQLSLLFEVPTPQRWLS